MTPILCTHPWRFAVVAVAKMVAKSRDSDLGGEIGYHIGHSKKLTEGCERVEGVAIPSPDQRTIFQRRVSHLEQGAGLLGLSSDFSAYCPGSSPSTAETEIKPGLQNLIHDLILYIHKKEPVIEKSILVFLPTCYSLEQQWYQLEPFHSTFEVHNILHRSIDTEQALAAMKICRSRRKGTMVKKRSTRPFLLIVLILLSICFGVAAEPYTIFRVDSDGNCFTEHPWKLFHIACLKVGKFLVVALVVGLIIGLIIIVFKWLNPTQAEEEKKIGPGEDGISSGATGSKIGPEEDGISSEQKERKILVESKEHEIEETEAKEASVNQLATNFGISEINPCMEVGGFKVFKGTRDNRLVSEKGICKWVFDLIYCV